MFPLSIFVSSLVNFMTREMSKTHEILVNWPVLIQVEIRIPLIRAINIQFVTQVGVVPYVGRWFYDDKLLY